jgi:hypothetical protein
MFKIYKGTKRGKKERKDEKIWTKRNKINFPKKINQFIRNGPNQ